MSCSVRKGVFNTHTHTHTHIHTHTHTHRFQPLHQCNSPRLEAFFCQKVWTFFLLLHKKYYKKHFTEVFLICTLNMCFLGEISKVGIPYLLTIFVLKFEIIHSSTSWCVYNIAVCMANSVDPDQMLQNVASDLGLHCLQRPICVNT